MIARDQIIYLDNNATTQLDPAVIEEMLPFLTEYYGNPSSGYTFGRQVRQAIELARERVAALLGCEPPEIVFTSCGTESNNAAVNSALQLSNRRHVVTTAVEHSATRRHCETVAERSGAISVIGVDRNGELDLEELERAITPQTAIVTAMWANNETGVLFPVEKIAEIARRKRILFHTDAIQSVGKIPVRLRELPVNSLALSAHKLHGPKGVGALYVSKRSAFKPSVIGGSQENNRRAGTENVASIVGLGKAAECAAAALAEENSRVRAMRDRFENALLQRIPDTSVNGSEAPRLPNTANLSFSGVDSGAALVMFDRHHLCCSAGSACRTGSQEASHVLRAMGLPPESLRGSMRFSFGRFNTEADVDKALEIIPSVISKLRDMAPATVSPEPAAV